MVTDDITSNREKVLVPEGKLLTAVKPYLITEVWDQKLAAKLSQRRIGFVTRLFNTATASCVYTDDDTERLKIVPAVHLCCPFPGANASDGKINTGKSGFLLRLLQMNDAVMFGNATVVALVQDKWDRFGKKGH